MASLALSLFACSGEPLRVRAAAFKAGDLPASAAMYPSVTSFETASTVVRPGQTEKGLLGRASPDAVAIAIRFADVGAVYFRFSLFESAAAVDPKLQQLVESITKQGVLLPLEASGGVRLGTFVTEVTF